MSEPVRELTDLYRQIVLDHSRHPRHQGRPEHFNREAEGHNPLCGDKVRIYLQLQGNLLQEVAFEASGCAICLASASLMTETVHRRPLLEARASVEQFDRALSTGAGATLTGDLAALGGVSQYPSRIRCATLPWKTLLAAMDASSATVTTEQESAQR
jgi:nitrogen fixation NifU-like protein